MNKIVRQNKCLTPIDHYIIEESKGYCNVTNKAYILFDLTGAETLTNYITRKYYSSMQEGSQKVMYNKTLTDEVIYAGLVNLINGVAMLRHYKHSHGNINCETVCYYENNDHGKSYSTFMLADPWISPATAPEATSQSRLLNNDSSSFCPE